MQPVAIRTRVRPAPAAPTLPGAQSVRWDTGTNDIFIGVDPSLTATGVSILWRNQMKTLLLTAEVEIPGIRKGTTKKEVLKGPARLAWFRRELTAIFLAYPAARLAIEGYAFASKFSRAHDLGELGGVLRLAAHDCRIETIIVPPNTLKQFATGKGNVGKGVVIKEAFKRYGLDVGDDNEADAGVLSIMASCHGRSDVGLTTFQSTAMSKVEVMR